MKRIELLKLPPYCYPERISSSHLIEDLNEALADAGIHTTVIAPTPCRGIDEETRKRYKGIKHEQLANGSVDVYRFPLFKEGRNPVLRAFRYILCHVIQYCRGKQVPGVSVIYAASTPPTQGVLCGRVAAKLSKKYKKKVSFVYHLQDVFPDSLVSAGLTSKGSLLWKLGRIIEDRTYRYADKIVVISEDIKKNILAKGVPEKKIEVIPNWIDTDAVRPIRREENKLFDELGIERDRFTAVYAGNLGKAQGVDTFIEAAAKLPDVQFLIFGEGSSREEIAKRCAGCANIRLFPLMPGSRVAEVYGLGDLCLVSCKAGLGSGAVPSKTFSIMATATPVLLSFDEGTELWNLIEGEQCGICTHAGDSYELVTAIRWASSHREDLAAMGERARRCVEANYSKEVGTGRMLDVIKQLVE